MIKCKEYICSFFFMSCVKLWMTWWYYTIILYPGAGVHSSGAHSGVCIVLRRRDDVKVPEMGSLCPLVRPQLNISHNLGDIELLITTNYSHFPPVMRLMTMAVSHWCTWSIVWTNTHQHFPLCSGQLWIFLWDDCSN